MIDQLLGRLAGSGIAFMIILLWMGTYKSWWIKQAHKLAEKSDIALPAYLEWRVARFLRGQYMTGALLNALFFPLLSAFLWPSESLTSPAEYGRPIGWTPWYPGLVAGLPLFWIGFCLLFMAWPRWRASGSERVTHLGAASSVSEAFTTSEVAAIVVGAIVAVAVGAWGLWLLHAAAPWWALCAGGYVAALAAWWYAAAAAMNRPSNASDILELGWDDMFRFMNVRALTMSVPWMTAAFLLLTDTLIDSPPVSFWPLYMIAIMTVVLYLYLVFRQGRHLWRRAWKERTPPW
jgi:hypothetical protein